MFKELRTAYFISLVMAPIRDLESAGSLVNRAWAELNQARETEADMDQVMG